MDEEMVITITFFLIFSIFIVGVVMFSNSLEEKQCEILSKGNSKITIENIFIFKECYIILNNGNLVNADNYRGYAND